MADRICNRTEDEKGVKLAGKPKTVRFGSSEWFL